MQEEIWKDIEGYEGLYQVSNFGRAKSCARYVKRFSKHVVQKMFIKEKILSFGYTNGYPLISLSKDGFVKKQSIHRLVAIAFIPNPNNLPQVNHIDGNRGNNNIKNLEWVTNTENQRHSWKYLNRVNPNKGKKFSEETRRKMKLYWATHSNGHCKKVYCVELNKYFNSIIGACRELKISRCINLCCEGKRQTCGGYHWRWAEESEGK